MRYKILIFLILGGVTIGDALIGFEYQQSGSDLLKTEWQVSAKNDAFVEQGSTTLILNSLDSKKKISTYQSIERPKDALSVRLSADMACKGVVPGKSSGNKALFFLVQYDSAGKSLKTDRIVAMIDGTRAWASYKKVFQISPEAVKMRVYAQLSRCLGELKLKNIHLYPMTTRAWYQWVKALMLIAWGLFFCWLSVSYIRRGDPMVRIPLVICFGIILAGTTMPDEVGSWVLQYLGLELSKIESGWGAVSWLALDEFIHLVGFTLFGVILAFLTPGIPVWITCACLLMLAGGTELVQVFVESRTSRVFDIYLNSFGGTAGLILVLLFKMIKRKTEKIY